MDSTAGIAWIGAPGARDEPSANTYIPGVCNIGPAEIARRRRTGWTGAVITVGAWAALAAFDAPPALRLLLFFPAMMSATGFLQAAMHFCAYFGFGALFNFGPEAGKGNTDTVVEAEFRAKDRRKAWQIVGYAVVAGLVVAGVAYLL